MTTHIDSAWQGFAYNVIPKDASTIQVQEMRRSFYAGVWAMLTIMHSLGDGESDAEMEAAAQTLEAIERECQDFLSAVGTKFC